VSLINKMLKDLETRERASSSNASPKSTYEDLRPVSYVRSGTSSVRSLLMAILLVVMLAAGAFYFFGMGAGKDALIAALPFGKSIPAPASVPVTPPSVENIAPANPAAPAPQPVQEAASKTETAAVSVQTPLKPAAKKEKPVAPPAPRVIEAVPVPQVASKPAPEEAPTSPVASVAKPAAAPKPTPRKEASIKQASAEPDKSVMEKRDIVIGPQEQAEAHYREAAQFVTQGRAEDARATLYAALASYPAHHQARELLAAVALQGGRMQEAQELLTQGRKIAPDYLPFAQLLARINIEQGDEAQAIATLEGARAAGAHNADYLSFLAQLYQRAGRHAEAVKAYRETIAIRVDDARAWLGLGISLEATHDNTAAEAFTRAIQLGGLDAKLAQYAQQRLAAVKK